MAGSPARSRRRLRLIDANLDRAREGLRVLEDWCRFALERAGSGGAPRICASGWGVHHDHYKQARHTATDVHGDGPSRPGAAPHPSR